MLEKKGGYKTTDRYCKPNWLFLGMSYLENTFPGSAWITVSVIPSNIFNSSIFKTMSFEFKVDLYWEQFISGVLKLLGSTAYKVKNYPKIQSLKSQIRLETF